MGDLLQYAKEFNMWTEDQARWKGYRQTITHRQTDRQTDNAATITLQLTGIETVHIVIMQPNKWTDTANKTEDGANDEYAPVFISEQHNTWIYKIQEV